jgi:hypothetical protein
MLQKPDNEKVYAMIAVDYKKIVNPDAIDMREVMGYLWPKIVLDGSHHGQNRTNTGMVERISADSTRGREKHGVVDV